MFAAGIQRLPSTLWQSLADAGHVTLDLPVDYFPDKLGTYYSCYGFVFIYRHVHCFPEKGKLTSGRKPLTLVES